MGIYDAVSSVNDLVTGVTSVASSKREAITKNIMNGVLLFIVLAVFGCLDFATMTFHAEYIVTAAYWGTVTTKAVAGICAFNIGINLMMDSEIVNNKVLQELIITYTALKEKKQIDFEYYVSKIFNREQKRKAYISIINKKINTLNRFSRARSRLLYSSELPGAEERRKKNFYCRRRKELEELKSDAFIEKNLDSIFVRYHEVDPAVFELEIDGSPTISGVKTRGSLGVGRIKASSSMIFGMVAFSMFTTAFVLSANMEEFEDQMTAFWHYFMKAAEDIAVILWQTLQGMLRTRKIVSQQMTEPYSGRVTVLTAYLEWRLNNNIPDSKSYLEMKKEKESKEEVIEVTAEEYEKMKSGA